MVENIDTCVILCGGASKRIKTKNAESKIFLPFGGANLVAYQFKKMKEIFPKVFISCKENQRENIKKSLVDFAVDSARDSAKNADSTRDSANFDFTHPLTPSARERGQKAKSADSAPNVPKITESPTNPADSANSQNLNDIFIVENGDIFAPIFGIYNALNHLFGAESTAKIAESSAESATKITDFANFDFTHPLTPSAREGGQVDSISAREGGQKAKSADSAPNAPKFAESTTNPADSANLQNLFAKSQKAFFISCDSPLIRAKTIDILCKNSKDYEITCAKDSANVHYLVGVWSASLREILRQMIEKGDFKLQNIPTHIKSIFFDRAEFLNINTASDYKVALKALGA